MTEFERIKAMDVLELATYINKLQFQAIDNYENGYFPNGIFDNISMLEREVKEPLDTAIKSASTRAAEIQTYSSAKSMKSEPEL